MSYFPMFIQLENIPCLIVGGGRIALRKVEVLLDFGADVTVVAGDIMDEIQNKKEVQCRRRQFAPEDISGMSVVVAATDDEALNREVANLCRARGIPVNAVDQIEDCSFIFPAYLKQGEVVSAFSSGGQSPVVTQYLKKAAAPYMTKLLGALAAQLGSLRETVKEQVATERQRKMLYREILQLGLSKEALLSARETEEMIQAHSGQNAACVGVGQAGTKKTAETRKEEKEQMDTKSRVLFEKAKEHIPGGVNSPVRAFGSVGMTPRFIASAKGDKITDVDGNEFIDYVCSWGPGILGHAHPQVVKKVQEACERGLTYGAPTENEVVLAEMISELVPSMEVSRLVSSGTEAVMSAIRTARGYTGRDKIIKFKGCYHGHSDGLLVKAGSAALTTSVPDSAGVPADYTKNTLVALYNDKESVAELFAGNEDSIAAVIVEPVAANMGVVLPEDGFLEFLREITKRYGALLIFDEVITGFRLALGGAQEYFRVTPDLSTFGKIIGGGMPIGAYGGRREIMKMISPDGPVYQAGTLSGNPIATTAGIETLRILKEDPGIYERLEAATAQIAEAVRQAADGRAVVNQIGSLMSVFFTPEAVKNYESAVSSDVKQYAAYFAYLLDRGIYVAPSQFEAMFLSGAHGSADIEKTVHVMEDYFKNNR